MTNKMNVTTLTSMDKVLIGLKAVRDSGVVNVFSRDEVEYYAFHMGFFETVNWIEENKKSYMNLMCETDWGMVLSLDPALLSDLSSSMNGEYFFSSYRLNFLF